jgi:DNA polymerase
MRVVGTILPPVFPLEKDVPMKTLSIDIETYSDVVLPKSGVYRYCEFPNFEILLFAYSADYGPVQVVDLACGEQIPADVLAALMDDTVTKWLQRRL